MVLASAGLTAQNEQDALRYSFIQTGGTTRSLSMGGAFGAIGGDFSSMAINPAGLGIYRKGEFAFSPVLNSYKTEAYYLDEKSTDSDYKIGINHFGFVIPLKMNESGSGIKGLTFGFGFNKLRDYGQSITMKGVNNKNSLVDEFVYTANHSADWDPFTDGLAWETYLIDYDSVAGVYFSDFDGGHYGQNQRRSVTTLGNLGEYDLSLSANLSDKLFIGATLGIQKASYSETWIHSESDPEDIINFFESFSFKNSLNTSGTGINFKIGLLAKPLEFLRIGAAIHTPTFFSFSDDFRAAMETTLSDGQPVHKYENTGQFDYKLTTPFRAVGSLALVANKFGLVSIDYEYVDYSAARLNSSDYDFFDENEAVSQRYKPTSNLRLGAELHLANYFLRGGYALYGSPYVSGESNAGNNLNVLSAGVGYRDESFYIDLGFASSKWDQLYVLYGENSADLKNSLGRFSATVGFRF